MATLNGTQINNTYPGLIKTVDNAVIGAVEKNITDGEGNASTLSMGTTGVTFTGTVDLTGASVTGIAAAGLVAGTGTDSMKSDDALTTVASDAAGARSIAIGDGANANSDGAIAIGSVANVPPSPRPDYISIGQDTLIAQNSIAIGKNASAQVDKGVVIGYDASAGGNSSVAVGKDSAATGLESVAVGNNTTASANGAVAIGNGVTAAKVNTTTVAGLETLIPSTPTAGGIVMVDAGSTDRRLNIDASGALQIDSTPVGGDPLRPTILASSATQNLDLTAYNFFETTLVEDVTLAFTNIPTSAEFQYSFSGGIPYKVSELLYQQNGSLGRNAQDIHFKPDGTQAYVITDGSADEITAHNLSVAWDISTINSTPDATFDTSPQATAARGLSMSPDGTKMYITAEITNTAFEYTLATAFDITTATYSGNSLTGLTTQPWGSFIKPDGTSFYVSHGGGNTTQYNLSTPFDLSTAGAKITFNTGFSGTQGITMNSDGTKMFTISSNTDMVYAFDLSTPYDITTAVNNGEASGVQEQVTTPLDLFFKSDGSKLYVLGGNDAWEYNSTIAPAITFPTSVQNPPTVTVPGGATVTYTFYTLDSGATVYLSGSSNFPLAVAPGLISGDGAGSLISTLTTNPSEANDTNSIALGNGATANAENSIAIGTSAFASPANVGNAIAIGNQVRIQRDKGIAIGNVLQQGVSSFGAFREILLGFSSDVEGGDSIAIGNSIDITGTSTNGKIAIGNGAGVTNATGAVALGLGVIAATANTVSIEALEVQTDSTPTAGGIIMSDAGGTDRRINITAGGSLQVDGGTTFNTPSFNVSGVASSDICYSVVTIPANTYKDGDVVEFRSMVKRDSLNATAYEGWFISEQSQTIGSAVVTSATAKQICGQQSANNGSLFYQKTLWLTTGNMTSWPYGVANETAYQNVQGGDPIETQTIDWTTTQYLFGQVWQDSTTGTLDNYGGVLRKIN